MSIFGNQTNAYQNVKLAGMRIPTSMYGKAIQILNGTQRLAWNLLWYGDFVAESASQAQGGKGGLVGSGGKGQSNVYYAAIQAFLCGGPVVNLGNVWDSQGILLIQKGSTTVTVPNSGPYTVTVTPPGGGSAAADIGVSQANAYSVTANDYGSPGSTVYAGTQQTPMVAVSGSPQQGQYAWTVNPGPPQTFTYTFNPADAGTTVEISYSWQDPSQVTSAKTDPASVLNLTLFTGVQGQAPWGYLTTNHPNQAIGYTLLAHVDSPSLYLGATGELPGFTFEVIANPFGGGIVDTNPYDSLSDVLLNQEYGLQWTPADLDLGNIGGTWNNWSDYCVANSLFISLLLASQESASSIASRILQITNAELVCSGPVIKLITYGDTTAVGNGAQFTPNTTPIVDLDDDDYQTDTEPGDNVTKDPIEVLVPTILDAYNDVYVEYLNRADSYNPAVIESKDDSSIAQIGVRTMPSVSLHDVTSQPVAALVASLILQRSVYVRTQYKFTLGSRYRYLEPMDMVTVTDETLGLNFTPVRILSIDEDDKWNLAVVAEEFPWGNATPTLYPKQTNGSAPGNSTADPGNVNTPIILEANNRTTRQQGYQLWIAVSGENLTNWGGCHVWMSVDGVTYKQIEDINGSSAINGPSRMGTLSVALENGFDPDTVSCPAGDIVRTSGTTVTVTKTTTPNFVGQWSVGDLINVPDPLTGVYSILPIATVSGSHVTVTFPGTNGSNATTMTVYHVAQVDLTSSGAELTSGTQADADNDRTLCALITASNQVELISYETADLVSQSLYDLVYLRRGQLGTAELNHAIGDAFVRIDSSVFQYDFDPTLIGQTLYFKFTSFNTANQMEQSIAEVTAYSVTIVGTFRGVVDLALNTPLGTTGTIPPILMGSITYASTTTSITWSWSGLVLLRPDLTTTSIPNGSVAVTGLSPTTTYYFYPYYDEETETLMFVSGFDGVGSSSMGAIAQTAANNGAGNVQNSSYNVPLSIGSVQASTTTSGGGGGGGGGTGVCLRSEMFVESKECGLVAIANVEVGDELLSPEGWTRVRSIRLIPNEVFIRVELESGDVVEVTPTHPFNALDQNGNAVDRMAKELRLSDLLFTRSGSSPVRKIEVIHVPEGRKASVYCEPCHTFFAGEKAANVLTHNAVPVVS